MKNFPHFFAILVLLLGFTLFYGCVGDVADSAPKKEDSGKNAILSNTGPLLSDKKDIAVEIPAVRNQSRQNASGPKIPSGAYSEEFPGIYFIWDSKSNNNGYLFVDSTVFNVYTNFVLTTKESSEYWDFFIKPQDGQQTTEDGCYVFFLPRVSGKNNINMVFLSEQAEKVEDPTDPVDDPPIEDPINDPDDPIENPVDDPIEDPVDDPPIEDPVDDPIDDPIEDPIDDPIDSWIPPTGEYALVRLGPYEGFSAYHEGWVYASAHGPDAGLYRMRPDGTAKQKIQKLEDYSGLAQSVYHDGWLYSLGWDFDRVQHSLYRMRLDGSERMWYATENVSAYRFIIQDEWIYFNSLGTLYRIKTDGSGLKKLADNCVEFIIAGGYIFIQQQGGTIEGWGARFDTKIIRCDLDGTCKTVLIEDKTITFTPIFADSGYLYYSLNFYYDTNMGDTDMETPRIPWRGQELHRMKFDGTKRQTVVGEPGYWSKVVLKDGDIYYSHLRDHNGENYLNDRRMSFHRVCPDGTDRVLLCDNMSPSGDAGNFEIIGSSIYYWTHAGINGLYRLSLNGGSPEMVYKRWGGDIYQGHFVAGNTFYVVVH